MTESGRPPYADEQYQKWLDDMSPFLKAGNTLWYSMEKCLLIVHKDAIYEKYRLKDWFSEKVDAFRRQIGELINDGMYTYSMKVIDKIKRGEIPGEDEMKNLRFMAERHRSCQAFFVKREEVTTAQNIDELLNNLERENNHFGNVDDVAQNIKLETNQNQQ